jgi:carboxymethylenebutenolidase
MTDAAAQAEGGVPMCRVRAPCGAHGSANADAWRGRRPGMARHHVVLALACCAAVLFAGWAQAEPSEEPPGGDDPAPGADEGLAWREHEFLGPILVDAEGRTLYVFLRDAPGESACAGECATSWPPAEPAVATDAGLRARLSNVTREDGAAQLALDGRPLYRFAGDAAPGDALGQARNELWYVVRESDPPGRLNVDFLDGPGEHEVHGGNVTFGEGDAGYLARPAENGTFPGVVMIHEWWGLNANIRAMADALASHGYAVLAVDLFDGRVAQTPDEAMAQVRALDQTDANATMRAAVAHLREQEGAPAVASLGWCFGGGQSLRLALTGEPLEATVVYYGALDTSSENLTAIGWPVLGIFGADDESIPVETVRAFEAALDEAGVENEVIVYEGVGHAFANPSAPAWSPTRAMEAWARTLAFLDGHL